MEIDYTSMIEAGVHLGHQRKRWNPKFKDYLYKHINGISVIDLERTQACLTTATQFLTEQVKNGAVVLFVGTKKQAQDPVREVAQAVNMPFCTDRWLGGCLTNFETLKASLSKYRRFLQMEESGELDTLPNKESAAIRRKMMRMRRSFEGILHLDKKPDIIFFVDARHEVTAIREAKRLQIPVVGIVDTNSDPTSINFPIPANDDAVKSLYLVLEPIREAIAQGVELHKLNRSRKDVSVGMATRAKQWAKKHDNAVKTAETEERSTQV